MSSVAAGPLLSGRDGVPAIICGDHAISYRDLQRWVDGTAAQLAEQGCSPGERVGIYMAPDWRYVVALLALLRCGAVACPLSTHLPPHTVQAHLGQIRSAKLLTSSVEHAGFEGITPLDPATNIVLAQRPAAEDAPLSFPLDQPATIIWTSGSTGQPKAVLHTYGNHYFSALGSNENIPLHTGDRWLLSLPLYHVSGLGILFRCLLAGASVVIPPHGVSIEQTLAGYGITHVSMVSTQLIRMLQSDLGLALLGKLRAILLGGSAMPKTSLDQAYSQQLPIHLSYGLSEMASQVTTTDRNTPPAKRYTSGKLLKYRELNIGDDGEILVRGKTLFAGYLEGDMITRPLTEEGWFATGDLGQLDQDGYLSVTGRKDNMFISGGENIQPEEIEAVLLALDDVEQVVVVPVPDAEWGLRPVSFVKSRTGRLDPQTLATSLAARLPRFKIPLTFYPWPTEEQPGLKISRAFFQNLAQKYQEPRTKDQAQDRLSQSRDN